MLARDIPPVIWSSMIQVGGAIERPLTSKLDDEISSVIHARNCASRLAINAGGSRTMAGAVESDKGFSMATGGTKRIRWREWIDWVVKYSEAFAAWGPYMNKARQMVRVWVGK